MQVMTNYERASGMNLDRVLTAELQSVRLIPSGAITSIYKKYDNLVTMPVSSSLNAFCSDDIWH